MMTVYSKQTRLDHLDGVELQDWDFVPNALTQAMAMSGRRCDAGESMVFALQLQYMRAQILDRPYPELKARRLIPQQAEAPVGAEEYAYRIADQVGMFELITNYADDLPVTNVRGEKHFANISSFGGAVHFSVDEMERASMAGIPLQQRQMVANRSAAERKFEQIAWLGDAAGGNYGMLTHPNITKMTATKRFNDASITAQEVYDTLVKAYLQQVNDTNGIERPDTMVMSDSDYEIANNKFFVVAGGEIMGQSAMKRFKEAYPGITVETSAYMKGAGAGGTNVILAYRKDSEKVAMESPLPYTIEPPQFRNLATIINARLKTAGVIAFFPLSITVIEGV
ncbi:MAG: major capsid family protein [Plesiomonas shigelloides]